LKITLLFRSQCLWWALPALWIAAGCSRTDPNIFQGYIEGEYVYVASPLGGELDELQVWRGDLVTNGQPLFVLEHRKEVAVVQMASALVAEAEATLANARKGLRPSEIDALEAELRGLRSDHALAIQQQQRREEADAKQPGTVSKEELDRSRTRVESLAAAMAQIQANLETARLGARGDEILMAQNAVEARVAELEQAQWALDQKSQSATTNAIVQDTLYREGEWVAGGKPVVSLLPPGNLKVRFFLPQEKLADIRIRQTVNVRWDGADSDYQTIVRFISTRAEYTPPVIYSQESRAKLVFLVEAFFTPQDAAALKVGQPVDVQIPSVSR